MQYLARKLALPTAISAALAIAAALALLPTALLFVFKPLTTLLIIGHAWRRGADAALLRRWVLLGLVFSLLGDIALLWPQQGFIFGLLAFLVAHLCYLWAFTRAQRLAAWPWSFLAYGLIAGLILSQLWPGIPAGLRPPVVAYVLCLGAMAAQAAVVWWRTRAQSLQGADAGLRGRTAVLALGGLLFMTSDALLATNKFAGPLPLASLWVLASYWAAQWCIASWLAPTEPPAPQAGTTLG